MKDNHLIQAAKLSGKNILFKFDNYCTFAACLTGVWRSWLAYLHGVQVVGSSSLLTPTDLKSGTYNLLCKCFFYAG